jgi:RNA polymerase sigma-70 factor (ECF subfamily)
MRTEQQPYSTESTVDGNADERRTRRNEDCLLFERFIAGDERALMALFDRHHHRVYLYCLKIVGDHDMAQDLAQEMWEQLIRYCTTPREIHAPIAFMLTIARNLCLNHLRLRRQHTSLHDLPESEHPATTTRELSHLEELVALSLPRLPFQQREIIILHDYCGYSFDDIAEMLDQPSGALRMRASRARSNLGRIISSMLALEQDHESDDNETSPGI